MSDAAELARQDDAARARALDITRSWLVQAPAGSGKTALLIQRFLALLANVDRPERIVATTFTRKAAAEMRERVLQALRDAADRGANALRDTHDDRIVALAHAALARDRQLGWRLLEQPGRLRIVTIDALAAALARQAPLSSGLGALPGFVDDAQALYREAARMAIATAAGDDPHWQTFLQWQDNDAENATRLIAQFLGTRDRWPARMLDEDSDALRIDMQRALEREAYAAVRLIANRMPHSLVEALPAFAQVALEHLATSGDSPALCAALEGVVRERALPTADTRDAWCTLADWLLTRGGTFVQAVGARHGFPPKGTGAAAQERAQRKAGFAQWLREAAQVPGLAEAWHRLRQLPPPHFDDAAWKFVVATMHVLQRAAQALGRTFATRGRADFTEATLRALVALGLPDNPSDLLLAIDYRLSHLLVDEFQDTSAAQLALIDRLTEGWEPGDGRTLFAVGDPMQSIYRFRQAEVRLFLEAQARGCVADVPVGVVELARNFRSQRNIVDWVNAVFASVLPEVSDPASGEAAYCPAFAAAEVGVDLAPTLELVASRDAEADAVVRRIEEARAIGIGEIAVLVRARAHAQMILPALRRAGIAYSAVELEGLHERPATRDLLSLARALAQPTDRLAWLSVLRAPWCGLRLADLLAIAEATVTRPIIEAIVLREVLDRLSGDGRVRVERFVRAVAPALAARGDVHFATRVRGAWLALGGPACADSALDRDGADRVLALVAEHEHGGDLPDFGTLAATAERLFAEANGGRTTGVQIMTLHRAKGLQFDAVILPGLDQDCGRGEGELLRWSVREHDGERTLVLAPMRARRGAAADADPVYAWLRRLDAAEEAAELGRLLYVGTTRAKRRLHCLAVAEVERDKVSGARQWKRPKTGTALERLWDALAVCLPPLPADERADGRDAVTPAPAPLTRLPADWRLPPLPPPLPVAQVVALANDAPVFDWADATAAAIGTVAHRLLAQVARDGLTSWDARRADAERSRILAELGAEGVDADLRTAAAQRVIDAVARTLADERGRWLFDPRHEDARSEWALAGEDEGRIVHVIVDRSFVTGGCRYIVDFKTGAHLGGDPTAFLRQEFERYRPQLARYARIVGALDARPLRIALYHPLVERGWQEQPFASGE